MTPRAGDRDAPRCGLLGPWGPVVLVLHADPRPGRHRQPRAFAQVTVHRWAIATSSSCAARYADICGVNPMRCRRTRAPRSIYDTAEQQHDQRRPGPASTTGPFPAVHGKAGIHGAPQPVELLIVELAGVPARAFRRRHCVPTWRSPQQAMLCSASMSWLATAPSPGGTASSVSPPPAAYLITPA